MTQRLEVPGQMSLTFLKLYLAWHRISRDEALDAYTRQVLLRTLLDEGCRGMRRPTVVFDALPEVAVGDRASEDHIALLAALAEVPPRQRRCWLRYLEDLSVEANRARARPLDRHGQEPGEPGPIGVAVRAR